MVGKRRFVSCLDREHKCDQMYDPAPDRVRRPGRREAVRGDAEDGIVDKGFAVVDRNRAAVAPMQSAINGIPFE